MDLLINQTLEVDPFRFFTLLYLVLLNLLIHQIGFLSANWCLHEDTCLAGTPA
jgi:hypothetical protein